MWGTHSEHEEGSCSQSDTFFYQSVFAEHITKKRVGFLESKYAGSDSIIENYVLQGTFQVGTHKVEYKHIDEIIDDDVHEMKHSWR